MPKGRQCVPAAVNNGVWVRTFRPNKLYLLFSFAPPPPGCRTRYSMQQRQGRHLVMRFYKVKFDIIGDDKYQANI